MDIIKALAEELNIGRHQAEAAVKLIDEGNTIPFIARYRKEATGSLNDEVLRNLDERLKYLRNLEDRKEQVISAISDQGKMTAELEKQIREAATLVAVEDLYRPYKPKRRTRAMIAREKGLEPLANVILLQNLKEPVEKAAEAYISVEKGVESVQDAINGAMDILAEGISDDAKTAYKAANQTAVTEHLIKGYRILTDRLRQLVGTNRCQGGLCNYPDGEKYFRYLLNHSLGWSKSVDEYNTLLDSYIRSNLLTMQTLMAKDSSLSSQFNNFSFSITEPAAVLTDLKTKIAADFPQGPDVSYDIKYITEALQDSVSPAMYFLPQLDNLNINSIYINPKGTRSSQLYPTLAHEGYPGHLYQTTYFADSDPDLIRYLIAPDGYVEGWATYCELFSYSYADTGNPLLNTLAQANYATILCLYAKCDLGINALGWTENDVASYIADFGFTDKNVAHEMYLSMVSNPGNYCKYVLGWIGFSELKN